LAFSLKKTGRSAWKIRIVLNMLDISRPTSQKNIAPAISAMSVEVG